MDASPYFKGKRITVMGLGLLGRGVGDTRYLADCGAELIVTDLKSREELADSVAQLESYKNIRFVLGEHRLEDFRDRDLILKAAGVPLDSVYVAEAVANGISVRMSADLFAQIAGIPIIGITGTRGKSTVTHMLHWILTLAKKKVLLGGNVRGLSTLALLQDVTPEHLAVLELDSWQCQGFGDAKMSPQIAIFTTLYEDHLNYYHEDMGAYLRDKANIFLYQTLNDTLILGKQCAPRIINDFNTSIVAKTLVVDETKLPDTWALRVPGVHNRYNAALALAAARALWIPDATSRQALETFDGVPGRLEFVKETNGVIIYNDTTSTTPEATLAALEALGTAHTVLIAGGSDKKLELGPLVEKLKEVKHLILLNGSGTDRIKADFPEATLCHTLAEAVDAAVKVATPGDRIVLSPAFTSFGMFKNEFDRGDQFNALVNAL